GRGATGARPSGEKGAAGRSVVVGGGPSGKSMEKNSRFGSDMGILGYGLTRCYNAAQRKLTPWSRL
ncbi:hypothetical protein, partial [Salmonella enterica]|uniref:hypothetical protein n=1 Tax=Salmonella enterica TaxID=28901 RepID=UPI00398C56E0